jgi:RimJ/RimL family protein N-acetyltransferase
MHSTPILESDRLAFHEMDANDLAIIHGKVGCDRIVAPVRTNNWPSRGVAEKLCMTSCWTTLFHNYEHIVYELRNSS